MFVKNAPPLFPFKHSISLIATPYSVVTMLELINTLFWSVAPPDSFVIQMSGSHLLYQKDEKISNQTSKKGRCRNFFTSKISVFKYMQCMQ